MYGESEVILLYVIAEFPIYHFIDRPACSIRLAIVIGEIAVAMTVFTKDNSLAPLQCSVVKAFK